jgi:hypothetical protein
MNISKIEEAMTLLYQTFIEDQDVATQRGIAITAMNEMVRLLGGVDVVAKIESAPYSARLRAQHLFEDEPPQRTWVGLTGEMLLKAAQSSLAPEQYDHFEAMSKHQPDIYDRLAYAIRVQDE